jgi:hypothetical protein
MKNKTYKTSKYNLLTLNLIELKTYLTNKSVATNDVSKLQGFRQSFSFLRLDTIELSLKKALKLLYSYRLKNIVFLGFSDHFKDALSLHKNVLCVPTSGWPNGLITNKQQFSYHLTLEDENLKKRKKDLKIFTRLLQLDRQPDLIVLYLKNLKDTQVLHEISNFNKPLIVFSKYQVFTNSKINFFIFGDFFSRNSEKFLSCVITNLLK